MSDENTKVHGNTRKAADMALARREISPDSHKAIHEGRLTLAEAKALGRGRGLDIPEARSGLREGQETPERPSAEGTQDIPPQPTSRISKNDTRQFCWCGCEQLTSPGKRWLPGHDQRAKGIIKRAVREGKVDELSPQLKEYGAERGLI